MASSGNKALIKYRNSLSALSNLIYFGSTTLSGLQTLGEEYTGILQFDSDNSNIPALKMRILMVLLSSFGQKLVLSALQKFENSDCLKNDGELRPEAQLHILRVITWLKLFIPILERLHKAVFYWSGFYGQFSKRLTGIQYVLVRQWLKDRKSLYGFKILSVVTLVYAALSGATESINFAQLSADELRARTQPTHSKVVRPLRDSCPLCLEERHSSSVTPCGHLFCWHCLIEWLHTEQRCPVCREPVQPCRVVPLHNYL
ncbi:peroxisome biogenesis factor 10-like [Nilaparvata lugens]|uniref:peroxisome biogenesis factor 10-like n=1 Tax=Nilaparvata lugens TaxID=108931 RepID=UPI00193E417D|nr:peroxisome biogenesis factor 10-like [Nilaparvata lugens]